MTLRCIRCHKPLTRPAAQAGDYAWGPKCARLAGVVERRRRRRKARPQAVRVEEQQMELAL